VFWKPALFLFSGKETLNLEETLDSLVNTETVTCSDRCVRIDLVQGWYRKMAIEK